MSYSCVTDKFPVTAEQVNEWENLEEKLTEAIHRQSAALQAKVEFLRSLVPEEIKSKYGTAIDWYGSDILKQQLFLSTYPKFS